MSNFAVAFLPTRSPITPAPDPTEFFVINMTATQFNRSAEINDKQLTTLDGRYRKIVYSDTNQISIEVVEGEYFDELLDPLDDSAMTMFFKSVRSGETFFISDIDNADALVEVQMVGRESRSRVSAVDVAKFRYQFTVREVIQ